MVSGGFEYRGRKVLPDEVESKIIELAPVQDCLVSVIHNSITVQIIVVNILLKEGFEKTLEKINLKKH